MTAGNFNPHIHNEAYAEPYQSPVLDHRGMIAMAGRKTESLAGQWRFTLDPFEEGLRQQWHHDCFEPLEGRTVPWEYDTGGGDEIAVPSCWNLQKPEWLYYEGVAWVGRHFEYLPEKPGERVFLRVGAANYQTRVFLNGEFLGRHIGGATPFFVELTGKLADRNFLHLSVDNTRRADRVPMHHIDWFNYGGVYREVELVRVPATFIKSFRVGLSPDGKGIATSLSLSASTDGTATISIPELGIERPVSVQVGTGALTVPASSELWSPENPRLYDVHLAFGDDRVTDKVGFRTIKADGRSILLNGQPIKLKGICVHEDDVELGHCTSEHDIRRRYAHAKELGCNFMRLAHYPHHELAAQIADEMGVLLWEEIPVYWVIAFDNPETAADADNQLRELIERDINRASVIAWGVGNENADTEDRLRFMAELAATAHELDSTRLVSAACLVNTETHKVEDRLAEHLDLIGVNEYYGWYSGSVTDLKAMDESYDLDKPLVITEVGAGALAGRLGDEETRFSEAHQARFYRDQTQAAGAMKNLQGFCPWILYDFRAVRRQNRFQNGYNRKGVIAEDKATKKQSFAILRDFYHRWT